MVSAITSETMMPGAEERQRGGEVNDAEVERADVGAARQQEQHGGQRPGPR